jgi:hypothetical protein
VISAEPVGFELGDKIDNEVLEKDANLRWKSTVGPGDTDGVIVTLQYPKYKELYIEIGNTGNWKQLSFTLADALTKGVVFNKKDGLDGKLTIKNAYKVDLPEELFALRDIVLAGENDFRFSAPLQALLWAYMDGYFKEGDNPLKNYRNALDFVRPIWGNMKGPRWRKFEDVTLRLNLPELLYHYEKENFNYRGYLTSMESSPQWSPTYIFIHMDEENNCIAYASFTKYCLRKAGYKAWISFVPLRAREYHVFVLFKKKDGIYILDAGRSNIGLLGPFPNEAEAKRLYRPRFK